MRRIVFNGHLFTSETSRPQSETILRFLLEGLTRANELYLSEHPNTPPLYASGVRYQPEPYGEEDWDTIPVVYERGWGDCEDLACIRCAELRRAGLQCHPDFYISKREPLQLTYHIVVRIIAPNGRHIIEDPSAKLGMHTHQGHKSGVQRLLGRLAT
jgi:hypothetical protein